MLLEQQPMLSPKWTKSQVFGLKVIPTTISIIIKLLQNQETYQIGAFQMFQTTCLFGCSTMFHQHRRSTPGPTGPGSKEQADPFGRRYLLAGASRGLQGAPVLAWYKVSKTMPCLPPITGRLVVWNMNFIFPNQIGDDDPIWLISVRGV